MMPLTPPSERGVVSSLARPAAAAAARWMDCRHISRMVVPDKPAGDNHPHGTANIPLGTVCERVFGKVGRVEEYNSERGRFVRVAFSYSVVVA